MSTDTIVFIDITEEKYYTKKKRRPNLGAKTAQIQDTPMTVYSWGYVRKCIVQVAATEQVMLFQF